MSSDPHPTQPDRLRGVLAGLRLVSTALNIPGPVAVAGLHAMGADVVKVEPPAGDPLAAMVPRWYDTLVRGQRVARLDLKDPTDRQAFDTLLDDADLLVTAQRPAGLARLALTWAGLHERFPRLCQVAVVGRLSPNADEPGHDLTYQAGAGLVDPPTLPRTLLADLGGAERAMAAACAVLLGRERGRGAGHVEVALADVAADFAAPIRYGLTGGGQPLGGGLPGYAVYRAADGFVAVATLEPHFRVRLGAELGLGDAAGGPSRAELRTAFAQRPAAAWEVWAVARQLPLVALPPT